MIRNKKNSIYFIVLVSLFFLGCEKSSGNKKGKVNLSYNSITQLLEYGLTDCDENECIKNVNFAIVEGYVTENYINHDFLCKNPLFYQFIFPNLEAVKGKIIRISKEEYLYE